MIVWYLISPFIMLNHRQDFIAQRANFRRALSGDQVLFAALNYATLRRRNPKLLVNSVP